MIQPSLLLISANVLGGCLLLTPSRQLSRVLAVGGGLALGVCGFTPLGTLLLHPLEDRFAFPNMDQVSQPAGIIVLGGALALGPTTEISEHSFVGFIALGSSGARATEGLALAIRFPDARLIFSGGSGDLTGNGVPEGDIAQVFYSRLGLPKSRLTIERRSKNTIENANFSKSLLDPKIGDRWILVTSASHMPRAVGVFRKAGFSIIPYPVDYHTKRVDSELTDSMLSPIANLSKLDIATKEWIGLLVYWLTGKTDELLPD